jgi:hypothetical protein
MRVIRTRRGVTFATTRRSRDQPRASPQPTTISVHRNTSVRWSGPWNPMVMLTGSHGEQVWTRWLEPGTSAFLVSPVSAGQSIVPRQQLRGRYPCSAGRCSGRSRRGLRRMRTPHGVLVKHQVTPAEAQLFPRRVPVVEDEAALRHSMALYLRKGPPGQRGGDGNRGFATAWGAAASHREPLAVDLRAIGPPGRTWAPRILAMRYGSPVSEDSSTSARSVNRSPSSGRTSPAVADTGGRPGATALGRGAASRRWRGPARPRRSTVH